MSVFDLSNPRWMITLQYLLVMTCFILIAKSVSRKLSSDKKNISMFYHFITLSLASPDRVLSSGKSQGVIGLVLRSMLFLPPLFLLYSWLPDALRTLPWWQRSYICILPFWVLVESISIYMEIISLVIPGSFAGINHKPWLSKTVAEFWGKRWNRLFGDWLRQVCFEPLARFPRIALAFSFIVSGFIHEMLVSVPLWFVFKINCFGWMLLYFSIQCMAILGERVIGRDRRVVRYLFTWIVILLPSPLILNPGTLLIFHFSVP